MNMTACARECNHARKKRDSRIRANEKKKDLAERAVSGHQQTPVFRDVTTTLYLYRRITTTTPRPAARYTVSCFLLQKMPNVVSSNNQLAVYNWLKRSRCHGGALCCRVPRAPAGLSSAACCACTENSTLSRCCRLSPSRYLRPPFSFSYYEITSRSDGPRQALSIDYSGAAAVVVALLFSGARSGQTEIDGERCFSSSISYSTHLLIYSSSIRFFFSYIYIYISVTDIFIPDFPPYPAQHSSKAAPLNGFISSFFFIIWIFLTVLLFARQ